MMHLHNWGYLWHHCGQASAPKCGGRDSVGGREIPPMYDRRGSVGGRDTAPMCCRWDNLTGQYGWWQLTYHDLHNRVRATYRVVGDGLWYGHGSTSNCYARKWIWVCTSHGAGWCSVQVWFRLIWV